MTTIADSSFSRITKETIVRGYSTDGALTGDSIAYNDDTTINEKIDSITGAASGNSSIQFKDEGTALGTQGTVSAINFTGAGVTSSRTGDEITVNVSGASYTDEQSQDSIGTILVDSATIDFTYNDVTPSITGSVIDGSINTAKLGGDITEVGKALLDDTSISAQRTTLGLGSLATQSGTFSGTSSGTNTGDQSSIVGITGTLSQFNAAVTDADLSTVAGTETLTNKTLTTPIIGSIKGTIVTDTDGATITFDKNAGGYHRVVLGGNRTLAISNMAAGDRIVIDIVQDATGSRTVTWFTTIKWVGGSTPTLTTAINKIDTFGFICTSAGNYQGYIIGQNI